MRLRFEKKLYFNAERLTGKCSFFKTDECIEDFNCVKDNINDNDATSLVCSQGTTIAYSLSSDGTPTKATESVTCTRGKWYHGSTPLNTEKLYGTCVTREI